MVIYSDYFVSPDALPIKPDTVIWVKEQCQAEAGFEPPTLLLPGRFLERQRGPELSPEQD